MTVVPRIPVRVDLREYARWASKSTVVSKGRQGIAKGRPIKKISWKTIEEYIAREVGRSSGGREFTVEDLGILISSEPVLLAFDGLDEVANLQFREEVSAQIVDTQARLNIDAADLVILVATRPGEQPPRCGPPTVSLSSAFGDSPLVYGCSTCSDGPPSPSFPIRPSKSCSGRSLRTSTCLIFANWPHTRCNLRFCCICSIAGSYFHNDGPSYIASTSRPSSIENRAKIRNRFLPRNAK
ncbi:Uncharacterised protein [Mycolicibacterium fortuitum]|uniref:NACHT domain-containing protein n=1 Tax=Mycolicibacterium fortuitum TaxID=1766 RepID=A0A378WDI0_MYCFO|nr:Uncharacterised protein [Mycolicibacterium fortuitum]